MARYNKATKTMINLVCGDLERYGDIPGSGRTIGPDAFQQQVLEDNGLTDYAIERACANNYTSDVIYEAGAKAFLALVNWQQVLTKYRAEGGEQL